MGVIRSLFSKYFIEIHKVLGVKNLRDERLVTNIVNSSSMIRIIFIIFGGYLFGIFGVKKIHIMVFAISSLTALSVIFLPFTTLSFTLHTYMANFLYGFNSMLNANTIYAIFPADLALEANSYYCFIYLLYNIIISTKIRIFGNRFKLIVGIMFFFKVSSLVFMLVFKGFKNEKLKNKETVGEKKRKKS